MTQTGLDYSPRMLDELCAAGEVLWAGSGSLPGTDGWLTLALPETAELLLPAPDHEFCRTPLHDAVLDALAEGQALFFRSLAERCGATDDAALVAAIWDLVWAGYLTNDTLTPLRSMLGGGRTAHSVQRRTPRVRYGRSGGLPLPSRAGPPAAAGRWWRLPERTADPTRRAHATAAALLDRHGVVTRGAVFAERVPGGFASVYPVLKALEESGRVRRGYFVESLGGAQFAAPGAVDRLRALSGADGESPCCDGFTGSGRATRALVLAASDPANPYGAALTWPARPEGGAHRPGRKAGALVVLVDGHLVLYVERGGRTLLSWTDDRPMLQPAVDALALAVRDGWLGKLAVERADGERVADSPLAQALEEAGFRPTPRGLRLRA